MPQHSVQTTLGPADGASVVELTPEVPGPYTLVDHSMGRVEQEASGTLNVQGSPRPDIFRAEPSGARQASHSYLARNRLPIGRMFANTIEPTIFSKNNPIAIAFPIAPYARVDCEPTISPASRNVIEPCNTTNGR